MDRKFHRRGGKKREDNYTPIGDAAALATPIENMGLSERTLTALKSGGVNTAADIARRRMQDMYRIQNIGKRNCLEIQRALGSLKLSFRPDEARPNNADTRSDKPGNGNKKAHDSKPRPADTDTREVKAEGGRKARDGKPRPGDDGDRNKRGNDNKSSSQTDKRGDFDRRNKNKDRSAAGNPKSERALNESLSRMYAGLTINEIIMGGKRRRPARDNLSPKEPLKEGDLVKFCRKGKWGYRDWKGNVVIQPAYDEAFSFSEGLAGIEIDSLIGYIDMTSAVVIPCEYDCGTSFKQGLAAVSKGDKTGYIDKEGNLVVDFIYDVATPFSDGKAIVRLDERWGVLDRESMEVLWR